MRHTATFLSLTAASLASTMLTAIPAQAQTIDDEIIVTGTRFATPIDQVGRSVSILTDADLEARQQRFVYDALENVPGLQLTRTGSLGSTATVSLRGLNSNQTLVVIDGVVSNDPASFGNGFDFSNLDTADIARIEVLRGAQSTLYGSDAIGGVINIVTKDGHMASPVSALIEGGSFGTLRGVAGLAGGTERLSGRVSVSYLDTEGYSSADEANGNMEEDGFENLTVSAKAALQATDTFRLETVARYVESENDFDDFLGGIGPVDGTPRGKGDVLTLAGIATLDMLDGRVTNRLSVTYLENDRSTVNNFGTVDFDSLGERLSTELSVRVEATDWLELIVGAESDQQQSTVAVGFGGNQEIDTVGLFALAQLTPVENLTLNFGLREDSSEDFGDETTLSASAAYEIVATGTILRGSFAEGFRAPTAAELSFNPDLFAESSEGWDIGVEQPLIDGRARLSATWFNTDIDQLIAFDLTRFTFANVQKFSSEGLEVALDATLTEWLELSASYTYTDAVNLSTAFSAFNLPEHRVSMNVLTQPTDRTRLSFGLNWNGEEKTSSGVTLDDFFVASLRGSYDLTDQLQLFGRVENLFDADYQDNLGYGTAPASAFIGAQFRY